MTGEFKKRIELLGLDTETQKKLLEIVQEAGSSYPCLTCSSKDTCENFNWYTKWFSE